MVQKITYYLTDDLDGSEASETVTFSLDGTPYEIDLSGDHAREFRALFRQYAAQGRKAGNGRVRNRPARSQSQRQRARDIRAWAATRSGRKTLGLPITLRIPQRGRIPDSWERAYDAAQSPAGTV